MIYEVETREYATFVYLVVANNPEQARDKAEDEETFCQRLKSSRLDEIYDVRELRE